MKKLLILIIFITLSGWPLYASIIEDLDKEPIGAHEDQMIAGTLFSIGFPIGTAIDAEDSFLNGSTYTFTDSGTTKKLLVDHLAFSFGAFFEYMPIDYVGIRAKYRSSLIIERTIFGSEYDNETDLLFNDFGLLVGPSFHVTNRKWWDINIVLLGGYYYGKFEAAPIANRLLTVTGNRVQYVHGAVIGTEVNFAAYFESGFYLSIGFEWTMNLIGLSSPYEMTNTQTGTTYVTESSLTIHTFNLILAAGYAFDN